MTDPKPEPSMMRVVNGDDEADALTEILANVDRQRGRIRCSYCGSPDHVGIDCEVGHGPCAICGERVMIGGAEMHHPDSPEELGGIVHGECGMAAGWDLS